MNDVITKFCVACAPCDQIIDLPDHLESCEQVQVIIESGTRATIYAKRSFKIIDVIVGEHACVHWISFASCKSITIQSREGSFFNGVQIIAQQEHCAQELTLLMRSCGAEVSWVMCPLISMTASFDVKTRQIHGASRTKSNMRILARVLDHARLRYHGSITVDPFFNEIIIKQRAFVLLSGSDCQVSLKPCFDIHSPDVSCVHGAACGTFELQHLEYVMMRGMDLAQAQKILLKSRFFSLFDEQLPEQARCQIEQYLDVVV